MNGYNLFLHLKWRFKLAIIFFAASFFLFLAYIILSQFNIFLPDIFVLTIPLKLCMIVFSWAKLDSWRAYAAGLVIAPLYYTVTGYFIGLFVDKLILRKQHTQNQ